MEISKLIDLRIAYDDNIYTKVGKFVKNNYPDYVQSHRDSISQGQLDSKLWLVDELQRIAWSDEIHIEIIGGWFGFPLIELLSFLPIKQIDVYEIDPVCINIMAQYTNEMKMPFRVVAFGDYFERKEKRRRQLIINTSSEHMQDITCMREYYKSSPIVAVQSNNFYSIEDHINCVQDEDELEKKMNLKEVIYKGRRTFPQYTRFMTIGFY